MAKVRPRYLQILAYLLIIAIFIFTMEIVKDCGRVTAEIKEGYSGGDTIDIAMLYGPGGYFYYGDTLAGINQEIAAHFSKDIQQPIKIWAVNDPSTGMKKLESGAFDILASLPLDNFIKKNFPVSESVFLDRYVLVQNVDSLKPDSLILSSLELNGKEVRVAEGSSAVNRIQNLSREIGGHIEVIQEEDTSDELLCLQVANGIIPLALVNERIARDVAKDYPGLKYVNTVSFTQFQVWVFNPKDTLLANDFNKWFDSFKTSDTYREIISRY